MKIVDGYVRLNSPIEFSRANAWSKTFGCFLGKELRTLPGFPRDLHHEMIRSGRCKDGFVYYSIMKPVSGRVFALNVNCFSSDKMTYGSCLRAGVRACS